MHVAQLFELAIGLAPVITNWVAEQNKWPILTGWRAINKIHDHRRVWAIIKIHDHRRVWAINKIHDFEEAIGQ